MNEQTIVNNAEEPEGLENEDLLSLKDYPIDSILIRPEHRTVFEIIRRIDDKKFILDPDFQREFVWDETKQSRLIESMLMRIPLPVFYLAEQEDGKIIIVDGLQRIMTFNRFIKDEFALKDVAESLLKTKFSGLPPKLQSRIEDTNLILYLIDSKVPERARLDIFERVNSGVPLTRQQMRNSLYLGVGTRFLRDAAHFDEFLQATDGSLDPKKMRDREFINRFCAFYLLGYEEYKGDMDDFLANTLKKMNTFSSTELNNLSDLFKKSMINNYILFGRHSFRKHKNPDERRSVINAALFDVFSVFCTKYSESIINDRKDIILNSFYDLMQDEAFFNSITLSTGDVKKVRYRFEKIDELFFKVLQ
jgi:hypothetical protein